VTTFTAYELITVESVGFYGKEWGDLTGHPVICLHGGMDNCNTFQPIGPHLSPTHHYVALDFYGHGRTSHPPVGGVFSFYELVIHLRRVMEHFNFAKISIIGHSMGANIGLIYGSCYPGAIERLVMLDLIKPVLLPLAWHPQTTSEAIETVLKHEKKMLKRQPKSYEFEELVTRYVDATKGQISLDSARIMMERGTKVVGNGYGYAHDPLFNMPAVVRFSIDDHRSLIKNNLNCHLKIIKAKQGPYYEPRAVLEEFKNYYQAQCKSYEYVEVEGRHHVHMDRPEMVAAHINQFFDAL